jgi:hypothetical protein
LDASVWGQGRLTHRSCRHARALSSLGAPTSSAAAVNGMNVVVRQSSQAWDHPGTSPIPETTLSPIATSTMPDAAITEPTLLFRLSASVRDGMSAHALYEATRGVWKLGPRREQARLALAVVRGVVREVYEIHGWQRAGTDEYSTRPRTDVNRLDRWEFVGAGAPDGIRERYIGLAAHRYFSKGARNPVGYVNID